MSSYVYKPLVSGEEIRLLYLQPGRVDEDIEIGIFTARFQPKMRPRYDALSYVWGSMDNPRIIKVYDRSQKKKHRFLSLLQRGQSPHENPSTLAVTQNLESALRHLRETEENRIFWIDAICINQGDLAEKNAEVGRMGNIYSRAYQVVVWLGPETEDSDLAMKTLQNIGQDVDYQFEKNIFEIKDGAEADFLRNNPRAIKKRCASWKAIKGILDRDWFKRLWIIQEIHLATEAVMVVGFRSIYWPTFNAAFQWIWANSLHIEELADINYSSLSFIISPHIGKHNPTFTLESTKNAGCKDPKDRIYGILSLLEAPKLGVVPKYELSQEIIYEDFAIRWIKTTKVLSILQLCTMRGQGLPSWVPNLSIPCPTMVFGYGEASAFSFHDFNTGVSNSRLGVQGVHISSVNYVSGQMPQTINIVDIQALCQDLKIKDIAEKPYGYGGRMIDAYITTLVGGLTREEVPLEIRVPTLEDCRRFFYNCIGSQYTEETPLGHHLVLRQLRNWLPGRAFFTTADGHVGLCPEGAKCGDEVCVVLGSTVPLLFRPLPIQDDLYQLVGECYVYQLMHGEGLLGPIPGSWKRKLKIVEGLDAPFWENESNERVVADPRPWPLPSGWEIIYKAANGKPESEPFDSEGNPHHCAFEEIETKVRTFADPRLSVEALKARGINVKDFILI